MNQVKPRWLILIPILLVFAGLGVIYFFGFPRTSTGPAPTVPSSSPSSFAAGIPTLAPDPEGISTSTLDSRPAEGFPAPDFRLTNIEGEQVQLNDYLGQPILLNFWATWCEPCKIEMPAIQFRFEAHADGGFVVLGVNFDEGLADVRSFGEQLGVSFDLLLDPGGEVQQLYRVRGYPTSFFIGRDGIIRVQQIGIMTEGQLDDYLIEIGVGD